MILSLLPSFSFVLWIAVSKAADSFHSLSTRRTVAKMKRKFSRKYSMKIELPFGVTIPPPPFPMMQRWSKTFGKRLGIALIANDRVSIPAVLQFPFYCYRLLLAAEMFVATVIGP